MMIVRFQYAAVFSFVWIGFICAISFMEAWLKFRAPGITIPLGLGIGKLVFQALNYVEWGLVVLIFSNILYTKEELGLLSKITLLLTSDPANILATACIGCQSRNAHPGQTGSSCQPPLLLYSDGTDQGIFNYIIRIFSFQKK